MKPSTQEAINSLLSYTHVLPYSASEALNRVKLAVTAIASDLGDVADLHTRMDHRDDDTAYIGQRVIDLTDRMNSNLQSTVDYVNKIRKDLDAAVETETRNANLLFDAVRQCETKNRDCSSRINGTQDTYARKFKEMADRLEALEKYTHTHVVDASGACCQDKPVVPAKDCCLMNGQSIQEQSPPSKAVVDDGDAPITREWLLSIGFYHRPDTTEDCLSSPDSTELIPRCAYSRYFNIWPSHNDSRWMTSTPSFRLPDETIRPKTRSQLRKRAAQHGVRLQE